jgi:hypothetical protein
MTVVDSSNEAKIRLRRAPSRTQQKDREMKRFPDDISTNRGKARPCRGSVRARMLHLRAMGFFGLAIMTASFGWSLNALAVETQSGNDHWINTWTAGPMPPWAGPIPAGFFDQTVRQVVRISLGGEKVRVRLSNEFGFKPVEVGAAHVAVAGAGGAIQADTDRTLTTTSHRIKGQSLSEPRALTYVGWNRR